METSLLFLGEWKLNVEARHPTDLFPADLIVDIARNTNWYALQKEKENLAVTGEEMQVFFRNQSDHGGHLVSLGTNVLVL